MCTCKTDVHENTILCKSNISSPEHLSSSSWNAAGGDDIIAGRRTRHHNISSVVTDGHGEKLDFDVPVTVVRGDDLGRHF